MVLTNFSKANKLFRQGRLDKAVAAYQEAIALNPNFAWSHHNLGEALLKLGRFDEAVAAFRRAVELNPQAAWSLFKLGELLRRQQRFEEAVDFLRGAVEMKSDVPEFNLGLGAVLVKLGRSQEAEEYLRQIVELFEARPNSLSPPLPMSYLAEAFYYLGAALSGQQQWSQAVEFYRRSWEINPGGVESCLAYAAALGKLGQWSDAVEFYRQGLLLSGESGEVRFRLGQALGQLQQWSEAVVEYGRAIALGFAGAEVRHHLGYAHAQLGRWPEAAGEYRLAVQLYPRSPVLWQQLGDVLWELGERDEAVAVYRKALELRSDFNVEEKLAALLQRKTKKPSSFCTTRTQDKSPAPANLSHLQQQLGVKLEREGKLDEAAALYRRAIAIKSDKLQFYYRALEVNPQDYLIYLNLGNALVDRGMLDHAIVFYKKGLKIKPDNLEMNLKLGKILAEKNKWERASIYLSRAVEIAPESFECHQRLGEAQEKIAQKEPYSFCLSEKEDFIELTEKPRLVTLPVQPLTAYYLLGRSSSPQPPTRDRALIQIEFLDKDRQLIPGPYSGVPTSQTVGPYLYVSTSGENLSEFKTKVFKTASLTNYLRLGLRTWHNKKPIILDSRLQLAFDSSAFIEAAIVSYQKALKVKNNDYSIINKLGNLLEKKGRFEEALSYYRQVLEISDRSPKIETNSVRFFNNRVLLPLHLSLPYEETGYAIRSHSILKSLKEQGVDVLATTRLGYPSSFLPEYQNKSVPEIEEIDGIRYLRLNSEEKQTDIEQNYAYIENYAERLVKVAMSHHASAIHSASNFENGMAAVLAARRVGIKSIYEVRGFWHLSRVAKMPKFRDSYWFTYYQSMESAVVRQADAVVAISQAMKDELIKWGADSNRIAVIPNAVDTKKFKPRSPDKKLKRQLGLKSQFIVSFIGSLNEYEGVDLLIRAVAGLVDRGVNISLLIVGDGSAKQSLEKLVESIEMKPHIIFTNRVPFSDVIDYYALSDVCVFPRKAEEVCQYVPPLKLLEAMAMAKPVIVAALPPLLESVNHEETGLVCKPDDVGSLQNALLRIYNSPGLGDRLGKAARDWVKTNRQWSVVCQKYLEVYRKLFSLA